jgi:glycosyltransferase involved in cell wall biosynthesis
MKKSIVLTTINRPTEAIKKFAEIAKADNWELIIVGDQKTPHEYYLNMELKNNHVFYLTPEIQEKISKELSDLIGWNCIQRRNFGFIYAQDSDVIATVDDDNIPYDGWGRNVIVGKEVEVKVFNTTQPVFDPLFDREGLWHRGFPIQLLQDKLAHRELTKTIEKRKVLVQADLWNGEPDVDAICRIANGPFKVTFAQRFFYSGNKPSPFDSQNTFLHRSVFPTYFLFPEVGRMDDIWASYILQAKFPNSVVYGPASVYQERNKHDLVNDLINEILGYRNSLDLVLQGDQEQDLLGDPSYLAYQKYFKEK